MRRSLAAMLAVSLLAPVAGAAPKKVDRSFERMVQKVANMVDDDRAYSLASAFRLAILNVLWEDTGRYEGSSVGPNISDVTIEVEAGKRTYLMPVMRYENFTDKTADVKMDKILIPVGNQAKNGQLSLISLKDLLRDPTPFLSQADKGKIKGGTLLAPKRDSHVLVSAQHAFLPVPNEGQATFYPVIFNYQSTKKNPAVLTILVTRQGTSITIVDNARDTVGDGGSWGQRLYFNKEGQRAPLIAERMTDVKEKGVTANGEDAQNLSEDSNVLMLIQVPLEYREPPRPKYNAGYGAMMAEGSTGGGYAPPATKSSAPAKEAKAEPADGKLRRADVADIDTAVLGHGPTQGPYTELDGLRIARDTRFPVRVTLQFYQATSNGVVASHNIKAMANQIRKVYAKGDFVGSLVVPSQLDRTRPTNWYGVTSEPEWRWNDYPGLAERIAKYAFAPSGQRPRSIGL